MNNHKSNSRFLSSPAKRDLHPKGEPHTRRLHKYGMLYPSKAERENELGMMKFLIGQTRADLVEVVFK